MPGFIAKKLCPTLTFVKPDFVKYAAASDEIFKVLRAYDPNLSGASLDEAYLDLVRQALSVRTKLMSLQTSYCREHNLSVSEAVQRLRDDVKATTRLTVSAGASSQLRVMLI